MIQRRTEALQLQEEGAQTEGRGLEDSSGTWREETSSELFCATEHHLNTVENQDNDDQYSDEDEEIDVELWGSCSSRSSSPILFIPVIDAHSSSEHFSEDEEIDVELWSDDEAPSGEIQHVEEEDDENELSNLGSSSSSFSSFPIFDFNTIMDAHSNSEHFYRRRERVMEMSDEEDSDEEVPPRKKLRGSSSSWTLPPTEDFIPIIDSTSSYDFWWSMMRRRELMGGDENNYDEVPHAGLEAVEPEDNAFEVFEHNDLDRSPSPSRSLSTNFDLASFIDDSTGEEFFAWVRQNEDVDMSAYENMPHDNNEESVHQNLHVYTTIYVSLDMG